MVRSPPFAFCHIYPFIHPMQLLWTKWSQHCEYDFRRTEPKTKVLQRQAASTFPYRRNRGGGTRPAVQNCDQDHFLLRNVMACETKEILALFLVDRQMGWWCCPDGNIKRWKQKGAFGHRQCCLPFFRIISLHLCKCIPYSARWCPSVYETHLWFSWQSLLYLSSIAKLINYLINKKEVNALKQTKWALTYCEQWL